MGQGKRTSKSLPDLLLDYNEFMRRWFALAALGAAFLVPAAFGQRGGHGGFGGHAAFDSHGSMGAVHGGAMGGRGFVARPAASARWGFHGQPFHGHCFGCVRYRHYYPRYGYGAWYPGWGWYDDAGWYGDSGYSQPNYQAYDYSPGYSADDQQSDRLRDEVDRLSDEVSRLREERESQSSHAQAKTKSESDSAELIFRDKHTQQVENYAIVGHTLWIFDDRAAKKISLSELDIPATMKVNQERGVDFSLPQQN